MGTLTWQTRPINNLLTSSTTSHHFYLQINIFFVFENDETLFFQFQLQPITSKFIFKLFTFEAFTLKHNKSLSKLQSHSNTIKAKIRIIVHSIIYMQVRIEHIKNEDEN